MTKNINRILIVIATVVMQMSYSRSFMPVIKGLDVLQRYGGGRIVYTKDMPYGTPSEGYTPNTQIGIVNSDGTEALFVIHQIQNHYNDFKPSFSSDGRYIALISALSSTFDPTVQTTLYILEVATGKIVGVGGRLDSFGIIKWRPDSKALAYETQLANVSPAIYKVRIVNIDGTNDHIFLDASPNVSISNASWSPDGHHFLFYRHDYGTDAQSSQGSWVISDADGSHQHPVAALDKAVAWYPLGTTLAMDDNNGHLQLVDALSGAVEKMIDYPADKHVSGNWSPDGRYVTFAPTLDPDLHLHVVILDTTNDQVRQLDTKPGRYEYMSWSPNSRYLAVSARLDPGIASGLYILGVEDNSMVTLIPDSAEVFAPDWYKPISP